MNTIEIIFIYLIITFFLDINCQYPEDFSSIDQLTYLTSDSEEEVFISSYFQDSTSSLTENNAIQDFHNGIKIYPENFCTSSTATCTSALSSTTPLNGDDATWDYINDNLTSYNSNSSNSNVPYEVLLAKVFYSARIRDLSLFDSAISRARQFLQNNLFGDQNLVP